MCFRDSGKEIILGDLYIPRTHMASSRVGQRSYFVWTKLERKSLPREKDQLQAGLEEGQADSVMQTCLNSKQIPDNLENVRVSLMKRMLEAHSRKLTTLDLRDFLRGQNPRNFVFILTGRAFRKMRMLHEELNLPW